MHSNLLALIPARGGSKGVPGMNTKILSDKPQIQYAVESAKEIWQEEDILVSTDDLNVKIEAEKLGLKAPFLRPGHLANEKSDDYAVIMLALDYMESTEKIIEALLLLQPTYPFRRPEHVREAMKLFDPTIEMVVSVKETKTNPYYLLKEEVENDYLNLQKTGGSVRETGLFKSLGIK